MNDWEKFNEILSFNIEDITDADYGHAKRVCKDFKIRSLEDYRDLYVHSDALLLADLFENFGNICLKIHEFNPAYFLSTPGLAWQAALKKLKVKLDLLTVMLKKHLNSIKVL